MDNSGGNQFRGPASLRQLRELQGDFAATIDVVAPSTVVSSCGTWTVADLAAHLSYIHHWAAAMARGEDYPEQQNLPYEQASGALHPGGELRCRYEAAAADLITTLTALDPDAPARTLIPGGTVAFWHRRQVHETLVHLWDLRVAAGLELAVPPRLWADTVDEAVTMMHPRQLRLGRAEPAPVPLSMVALDVDQAWSLPGAQPATHEPAAKVSGPAEALALLVWGRTSLADDRLQVFGDRAALQAVLDDHFVP